MDIIEQMSSSGSSSSDSGSGSGSGDDSSCSDGEQDNHISPGRNNTANGTSKPQGSNQLMNTLSECCLYNCVLGLIEKLNYSRGVLTPVAESQFQELPR